MKKLAAMHQLYYGTVLDEGTRLSQPHAHSVMLVEDDEAIRTFEAIQLIDQCVASNDLPCLILVDRLLPYTSGSHVIQHIRAIGLKAPIVAISTKPNDLPDTVAAGVALTIAKPFDIEELNELIQQHCPV